MIRDRPHSLDTLSLATRRRDSDGRLRVYYTIAPRWIATVAIVIVTGVLTTQAALVYAGTVALLALALSWAWGRLCLEGVAYRHTLSAPAVPFGEEVTLLIQIVNRKALPVLWLDCSVECPATVELLQGDLTPAGLPGRRTLSTLVSVRGYERVTRRYRLRCPTRGEHLFGPVGLRAVDLFGLTTCACAVPADLTLLVYPKVVPVTALGLSARFPLGDVGNPHRLVADPTRVVGVRPYTVGDSVRSVHWKATAHRGTLQVKVQDPSATLRVLLCVNADMHSGTWMRSRVDLLELSLCVAASLATHLARGRYPFGLITNDRPTPAEPPLRVPVDHTARHVAAVLARLARLTSDGDTVPIVPLLRAELRGVPAGTALVIITSVLDDALLALARSSRAGGYPVRLLLLGDDLRAARPPGLDTYWVGDETCWRDLRAMSMADRTVTRAPKCTV